MQRASVRPATTWPLRPILPAGLAVLLVGVLGGLARIGVLGSHAPAGAVTWHGPLLVFGFFGTLISVERAVALRRSWAFAAPVACIAGSVAVLVGASPDLAAALWVAAGLVALAAVVAVRTRSGASAATRLMALSCAAWVVGAAGWSAGWSLESLLPWWALLLVAMIVGERVQFSRTTRSSSARFATIALFAAVLTATLAVTHPDLGLRATGTAFAAIAAWFLLVDGRTRKRSLGLARFIATGIALAYAWLLVTALTWVISGAPLAPAARDLAIHACFLGFAMSMVFAHAPMVFPALTGMRVPFLRTFWVHAALLHVGLAVRALGALLEDLGTIRLGSTLTAVALLAFVASTASSILLARLRPQWFPHGECGRPRSPS